MLKSIDPIYYFLRIILQRFFVVELEKDEKLFLYDNINKHRKVLWINIIASVLVFRGLGSVDIENIDTLILALVAPVMVLGGAWFSISFGGIPAKLIESAMSITFWMLGAFFVSLSAMFLAVGILSPAVLWPVLAFIYFAAIISSIQYDTADGLKAGLDDAILKHSRAALRFYKEKEGINIDTH